MKPLTNYVHKAMIPFAGLPFLAYSLHAIPRGSEVVMVVNYLAEQIAAYFGDRYAGTRIKYLKQNEPRGTGDALFQFAEANDPQEPVMVWQADQLMFPDEVESLLRSEANAALHSDTPEGLMDVGVWKIRPDTLRKLKGHFQDGEYRALPVLKTEGLNVVRTARKKAEISLNGWTEMELLCKAYKNKFVSPSR